jgi:hypothetical protein
MPTTPSSLSPLEVAQQLERFLLDYPHAAVLEDGAVLFDMRLARYSVSSEHNRCLLHLWSEERNIVRTVTGLRPRAHSLQLETRRFGQSKPQSLLLLPDQDRRTPTARDSSRRQYLSRLERIVTRSFEGSLEQWSTAMDLEQSLGPAYARGLLVRGRSAWAIVGVNAQEDAATLQNAVTIGVLWMHLCRERLQGRRVVEGLRLVLPRGAAQPARERMAWLDRELAKWELYEYEEASDTFTALDVADTGNLQLRLTHAFAPNAAIERAQPAIASLLALLPEELRSRTELRPRSAAEVGLLLHGLEYARIRHEAVAGSFHRTDRVTFGAGASETELNEETQPWLIELAKRLALSRHSHGHQRDPLYRLQPEQWLEAQLRPNLERIDPGLRTDIVYAQVPAFSAADRGMLDLLAVTQAGRLAVLELKADEDPHLPLQALDYWIRVRALHRSGELIRHGYFSGVELSPADPLLYLVAPALRLHPTYQILLRYFAPEVEWQVVGLDERWREAPKVILRRRRLRDPVGSPAPP